MSEEVRLLILDIDEVATNHWTFMEGETANINSVVIEMINDLCHLYNLKISFISTWADHGDGTNSNSEKAMLHKLADAMGFHRGLVWHKCPRVPKPTSFRGDRMRKLLTDHPEITDYVIIDDSCDYYEEHQPRLVHIDSVGGFTARDYLAVRSLFEPAYGQYVYNTSHSGIYTNKPNWIYTKMSEETKHLKAGESYREGEIVYLPDSDCFVQFNYDVEPDITCGNYVPIVLVGRGVNARVLKSVELNQLFITNFIQKHGNGDK
ncbi:hypothetical protein CZP2022_63 [Vibrio phage C-ZP2022]|nr:hypothetical protein CZP2022_63 [Vibrio phage C-ZP2022]